MLTEPSLAVAVTLVAVMLTAVLGVAAARSRGVDVTIWLAERYYTMWCWWAKHNPRVSCPHPHCGWSSWSLDAEKRFRRVRDHTVAEHLS